MSFLGRAPSRVEPFGLRIDATSITQFQFSPSFTSAIEAKVAAEQNALTAQRNLERARFEAQQQVELARAQAQALTLQKTAVTPELVALRRIEAQLKGGCGKRDVATVRVREG